MINVLVHQGMAAEVQNIDHPFIINFLLITLTRNVEPEMV